MSIKEFNSKMQNGANGALFEALGRLKTMESPAELIQVIQMGGTVWQWTSSFEPEPQYSPAG